MVKMPAMNSRRHAYSYSAVLTALSYLPLVPVTQAAGTLDALAQPCPIDWRDTRLSDAIRQLSDRLGVPYVLDSSVTDAMLDKQVRFAAAHLSGRQAFRWTVRVADLDAILVNGAMLIAEPERVPQIWQSLGTDGSNRGSESGQGGISSPITPPAWSQAAEVRRADLDWVEAPLSLVAHEVSVKFGVDLVFHPAILAEEPHIRLKGTGFDLKMVRKIFIEQMKASCRYDDGVLWVEPGSANKATDSRPAIELAATMPAGGVPIRGAALLTRTVSVELGGKDWGATERELSRSTGIPCRINAPAGTQPPVLSARGSLAEVLEALRLLAGWRWQLDPGAGNGMAQLAVTVPG